MTSGATTEFLGWNGNELELMTAPRYTRAGSTVIEVVAAGVCGTDLHVMRHTKIGTPKAPLSLGHEILGRVLRVGSGTPVLGNERVAEGDLVAVVPGIPCGRCTVCLSFGSHEHLCPQRVVHGFSTWRSDGKFAVGGYATHIELVDDVFVARVPEGMPWQRAALSELTSIAVRATERALGQGRPDLGMGTVVAGGAAVLGAGPVGTAVALVLKAAGADVLVFESNQWRADYARERLNLDVQLVSGDEWVTEAVRNSVGGLGFDVVVECGGSAELFVHALDLARAGGRVVELGNFISTGSAPVDPSVICRKDLEVVGSVLAPPAAYLKALRLLGRDDIPFDRVVSETLSLREAAEPGRLLGPCSYMKRVIRPSA
ncbi:zinc-dependent alcohol dehydrogenase [Micromonospora sp. DT4]|uniref:zinc-dependent alcohol dehydrogenase n=1 Tax=Micromonospora sp. DT4 TaxID=3393438 RepID=UPI003CEE4A73